MGLHNVGIDIQSMCPTPISSKWTFVINHKVVKFWLQSNLNFLHLAFSLSSVCITRKYQQKSYRSSSENRLWMLYYLVNSTYAWNIVIPPHIIPVHCQRVYTTKFHPNSLLIKKMHAWLPKILHKSIGSIILASSL